MIEMDKYYYNLYSGLSNLINIKAHIVRLPEFHKFLNNQWIYLIQPIWLMLSNFKNIQYQNSKDNF